MTFIPLKNRVFCPARHISSPVTVRTEQKRIGPFYVKIIFKRALKTIRLCVRRDGEIVLSVPLSCPVKTAEDKKYVLMNAPREKVDAIVSLLPGMKSPTVMPLAQEGWCSVHTVLDEKCFWEIIGKLKALGAEGILVLPIEKMIV